MRSSLVIGFNATFSVAKNCDESVGKIDELASTLGFVPSDHKSTGP